MKAILRSINNFSCKLKQINNLKYNISPKIRSNKFKSISGNGNVTIEDALNKYLKDYKVYGNTKQQILPDGYTQVDYIESSGTQYIDTGFKPNQDTRMVAKVYIDSATDYNNVGGARNSNNEQFHIIIANNRFDARYGTKGFNISQIPTGNKEFDFNKNNIYINDELKNTFAVQAFQSSYNAYIFCVNNTGTPSQFANYKLYNMKWYDNDILVRDFVPCYRNSDNEVGLYDLVNNVFYTNQGSGVFTYGSVAPTPEAKIDMVSCGDRTKNMFDINSEDVGYVYDISGNYNASALWNTSDWINVKENTKYIRSNKTTNTTNAFISEFDGNKNFIQRTTASSFTTTNNTKYIKLSYKNDLGMYDIQLEENSIATSYEPYGYKIPVNVNNVITNIYLDEPLRKIGDYADYIDFINGKLYRKIEEHIFTGTTDDGYSVNSDNTNTLAININPDKIRQPAIKTTENPKIYSDKLNFISGITDVEHIYLTDATVIDVGYRSAIRIYVDKTRLDGYSSTMTNDEKIELVKTWLQSNPLTTNYITYTPIEEDIELPNIKLIEGKNIISIGTEVQGVFEVEYYSKEIIDISDYKYNLRKVED